MTFFLSFAMEMFTLVALSNRGIGAGPSVTAYGWFAGWGAVRTLQ
jgi:hypothetical protein